LDVPPPGPANDEHVIIDSTLDVWRGGISYDFNSTFAPFGSIYETGFRFRLTPNYSWFQFKIPDTPGTASGQSVGLDIMPGIGIVVPKVSFIALVGPVFAESFDSGRTKTQRGLKTTASMYATPTDLTMFYGSGFYTTIGDGFQVQLKTGVKVPAGFYLGPEFKISGSNGNTQLRYGAHLSSLKVGQTFFSFTAGYLRDEQLGRGEFVSMNVYTSF
jgi:hypothetical protein